ncbi:DNA-binding response regulator, partial [Paenibacillus sp. EKM208P]
PYDEKRIASMLRKLENAYEQQNVPIQEPVQTAQPRAAEASTVAAPGRINLLKNDKIIVTDANDIYYACAQEKVTHVF